MRNEKTKNSRTGTENKILEKAEEMVSFEEAQKQLIDTIHELEPFGAFVARSIAAEYPHLLSSAITLPHPSNDIKEFGYDVPTHSLGVKYLDMAKRVSFERLKIQVAKEAYAFCCESYLIRIVRSKNKYPKYYHREVFKTLDSDELVEVVFFAKSKKSADRIKERLNSTMGDGSTLQDVVENMHKDFFNEHVQKFADDDKVQKVAEMAEIMTDAYFDAKSQPENK